MNELNKAPSLTSLKDLIAHIHYLTAMTSGMNAINDTETVAELLFDIMRACQELASEVVEKEIQINRLDK